MWRPRWPRPSCRIPWRRSCTGALRCGLRCCYLRVRTGRSRSTWSGTRSECFARQDSDHERRSVAWIGDAEGQNSHSPPPLPMFFRGGGGLLVAHQFSPNTNCADMQVSDASRGWMSVCCALVSNEITHHRLWLKRRGSVPSLALFAVPRSPFTHLSNPIYPPLTDLIIRGLEEM